MSALRELNAQRFCGWCGAEVEYESTWMSECPGCGYRNYLNPNPCSNLIVTKGDAVLMVRRAIEPHIGKLDFPGGFMEMSDLSMEAAALRELEEEVGISPDDLETPRYLTSIKSPEYVWQGTVIHNVSFYYACELKNHDQVIEPDKSENSEVIWVTKKDIETIDYAWDIDKDVLTKYFKEST